MPDPAITAGTYLRKRREAALLSIADVAMRLATEPPIGTRDRATWLEQMEADLAPISFDTIQALGKVPDLRFSRYILNDLVHGRPAPPLCRTCACSWLDPCVGGCCWVEPDLCSVCLDVPARVDAIHAAAAAAGESRGATA